MKYDYFNKTGIYYPALGYEIKNLNGVISFTKDSIFADAVTAKIENEKVLLSALTREGKSGKEVVFHLDGKIPADYLLQHYANDYDFELGQNYKGIFYLFVPRGLYPQKPVYTVKFTDYYKNQVGMMPITFWGESYINFSWIGIVVLSFLLGLISDYVFGRFANEHLWAKIGTILTPNLQVFWISDAIYEGSTVEPSYLAISAAYTILYATAILLIAIALFQRRQVG